MEIYTLSGEIPEPDCGPTVEEIATWREIANVCGEDPDLFVQGMTSRHSTRERDHTDEEAERNRRFVADLDRVLESAPPDALQDPLMLEVILDHVVDLEQSRDFGLYTFGEAEALGLEGLRKESTSAVLEGREEHYEQLMDEWRRAYPGEYLKAYVAFTNYEADRAAAFFEQADSDERDELDNNEDPPTRRMPLRPFALEGLYAAVRARSGMD